MKFQIETTKSAIVEIYNEELFNEHLEGDLKEGFWDFVDDYEGAVENIIHQFYWEGDGAIKKIDDKVYRVKFLEGWGDFLRDLHTTDEWVNDSISQSYIGKIVIKTDGEQTHYTEEL